MTNDPTCKDLTMTNLTNISEIAATWPVEDGWKIAPAGLAWVDKGSRLQLGVNCLLDTWCRLGDSCRLGNGCVLGTGCELGTGCRLGNGCELDTWCLLGDECVLDTGCRLGYSCRLGNGCELGTGCRLGYSCHLGDSCRLGDECVLGTGCVLGTWCRLGDSCRLGDGCVLDTGCVLGKGAADPIDLGFTDGYQKIIAQVRGVAYIGAGCRWFTLEEAQEHWKHRRDRVLTRCILEAAKAIAKVKGWKTQEPRTSL